MNAAVFAGMIYLNYLGGTGQINDISTGEVSGLYPTLFTPAGITFSIWSIIYLFNLAFVIYQIYKSIKLPENLDVQLNQGFFFISVTNAVWVVAWHRLAIGYSLFLMLMLLVFLAGTYLRAKRPKYRSEYFTEYVNFSIYLGWISVATIANVAIFLTTTGFAYDGQISAVITVIMMGVATVLALYFLFYETNYWYTLVVLWALMGIFIARNVETVEGALTVSRGAMGLIVLIMVGFYLQRKKEKDTGKSG